MITVEQVEKAQQYLIDSAAEIGRAVENAIRSERMLKHIKALEMKKRNENALGAQEREAYASDAYKTALLEEAVSAGELAKVRALRDAAESVIRIWQSENANMRAARV
jgi:hypothetical protein